MERNIDCGNPPNIRNSLLQEGSGSGIVPAEDFARLDGSDKDDGDGVVPC